MSPSEYQALAEFRFLIRQYLNNSEKAARSVGLEPQQYQSLLALRGLPAGQEPTIRNLAERLQIRHHSVVELVDRMQVRGLFRRTRSKTDRRRVLVHVTPRGEKLLSRLVRHRIAELRVTGPTLARALSAAIGTASSAPPGDSPDGEKKARRKSARRRNGKDTTQGIRLYPKHPPASGSNPSEFLAIP